VLFPGILDVNGSADFDVTDFDIASSGDIDLLSTNDAAAAIYLRENAGTSGTIKIHADQGTSVTEGAESINILSDAGGVGIRSTANLAKAVNITSDGGTTGSIAIFNDQGTSVTEGAESISLLSDAGGIGIRSTADLANAVNLTVDGGTSSTMTLFNDQGTAATEGAASIQLLSDVGGINVKSGLNGANAILLTADGGTSETIVIHADQGTGAGSISAVSDAGGITLDAGLDIVLSADGGNVTMDDGTSTIFDFNVDDTTLTIHDDQDTGDKAVITMAQHGALSIETTDDDAAAANLSFIVDGAVDVDAAGAINLDTASGIITFEDGGTEVLRLTEGNSGDVTVKLVTNAKDLIFTDNGDATNMKILDAAAGINVPGEVQTTGIGYTDGDNAMTIADGGAVTFPVSIDITGSAGIILENDETITNSTNGLISLSGNLAVPDGGTIGSASDTDSITIASDGVVTMDQIPVFSAGINVSGGSIAGTLSGATQNNITTMTGLVTTGALASGSIASGFGTIDTGSSTITTTGVITAGGFTIGNAVITEAELEILDGASGFFPFNSEVTASGGTFSSNNHRLFIPPGTTVTSAIVLSGTGIVLVVGAQCDIQSTVTLSGANCSLICQNGVDLDGIIVSGNFGYVNGGGWDTLSHGGSANDGINVSGTDVIVQNISAQTSGGGYDACESSGERTTFDKIKVVGADRFGFLVSADEAKILNSVIADSGSENIFSTSTEGLIANNYCNSAGLDGIECDDAADNSVIIGNIVRDQASDAIEVSAACENCVVVGNRTDGAIADNSGTSTVTGNDATAF
jgi:hypothetical protein